MPDDEPRRRRRARPWQKWVGAGASLALLVLILVGVLPQFGSYSGAWTHISQLDPWAWGAIAAASVLNQISGIWPYQAAMPGLRFWDGLLQIETATAISNTVPAGGAVAIGMTYRMFSSFGFSDVVVSAAVMTTGVWTIGAKLCLPVVAVALLAVTAHATVRVVEAAMVGVGAVAVAAALLWWMFRSEAGAHRLGHSGDRLVNWVVHFFGRPPANRVEGALLRFVSQTVETVRRRGWWLTWATLANQAAGFALVLIIVRAVGITGGRVGFAAVLTAFAVARLASAIPITPGGLGTTDATFISLMVTFGSTSSEALTADVVWRLTVYLVPIVAGIVSYLIWFRWHDRHGRMAGR